MNALLELARRCERASANEQADVLIDAYEAISRTGRADYDWATRFMRFIDAEAYESAALTLIPDWASGWSAYKSGTAVVWPPISSKQDGFGAQAATPALALCAAALKARAQSPSQGASS